ncbi:MAG: hypothetical protein ACE5IL_03760 [Myxococcota bacterium]
MATIWIISDDPALSGSLARPLANVGRVATGRPEAGDWKAEAGPPDLLVLLAISEAPGQLDGLERLLEFVRGVRHPRRSAPGVLYVEPTSGHPAAALAMSLIDDRPARGVRWPLDPLELASAAEELLDRSGLPPTLRERAQRDWVQGQVEHDYAGLELPALRHAIDPRNAARPVMLMGEPGSRRGLLARYIHLLAEPPRQALVVLPPSELAPGTVESCIVTRTSARRVTVYLPDVGSVEPGAQDELAHLLGHGGLLGVDPIRWIASSVRWSLLSRGLREIPWLRVDLPALRERRDVRDLVERWLDRWQQRTGRRPRLDPEALSILERYAWPGNLAELDAVLQTAVTPSQGDRIDAESLPIRSLRGPGTGESGERASGEATPGVRFESGESIELDRPLEAPPVAAREAPEADTPPRRPSERTPLEEIVAPLAVEVREPVLAIRTYASLLGQRPDDETVRRELSTLLDGDLSRIEETLQRLERFAGFEAPVAEPVDLAALVATELEARRERIRERSLILLEELDRGGPPTIADPEQLRFAVGGILDRALRMVPDAADLYVGSQCLAGPTSPHPGAPGARRAGDAQDARVDDAKEARSRQRLLIRFHSPEDVLVAPAGAGGPPMPLEVVLAKALVVRMGGAFAADASGASDNVILLELPAADAP